MDAAYDLNIMQFLSDLVYIKEKQKNERKAAAFADIFAQIRQRVTALLALPLERMSSAELKHALQQIGQQTV